MWLDCAANQLAPPSARVHSDLKLDWHFGPFAMKAEHVGLWTDHHGELWDAQVIPIVYAARMGLAVRSATCPFEAPAVMKEEEENNLAFVEKRIMQLNFLDPKVKSAWQEEMYGEQVKEGVKAAQVPQVPQPQPSALAAVGSLVAVLALIAVPFQGRRLL